MTTKKFIFCENEDLAKKLSTNYKLLSQHGKIYIFENNPISLEFSLSEIDKTKIQYSNKLLI